MATSLVAAWEMWEIKLSLILIVGIELEQLIRTVFSARISG
jgi:hypothetical protein